MPASLWGIVGQRWWIASNSKTAGFGPPCWSPQRTVRFCSSLQTPKKTARTCEVRAVL